MVPSVARQSVIIKCNMQASSLLGNYEFYYAAGLFCRLKEMLIDEDISPNDLSEKLLPELKQFSSEDPKEQYLARLLLHYEPTDAYDEQMKELLHWGRSEDHIWQMH